MLYTRKGDKGTTTVFGCDQRTSKSSVIAEALGALDEINSFLGLCKTQEKAVSFKLSAISFSEIVHQVQQNLFYYSSGNCRRAKIYGRKQSKRD